MGIFYASNFFISDDPIVASNKTKPLADLQDKLNSTNTTSSHLKALEVQYNTLQRKYDQLEVRMKKVALRKIL